MLRIKLYFFSEEEHKLVIFICVLHVIQLESCECYSINYVYMQAFKYEYINPSYVNILIECEISIFKNIISQKFHFRTKL